MEDNRLGPMLWRSKYLVLLAVAAMLGAAVVVTALSDRVYEATTLLRVQQSTAAENGSDAYNAEQASQTQAATYATLLTSPSFLNRVAPRVNARFASPTSGPTTGAGLADHVRAEVVEGTNLIALTYRSSSRSTAVYYARVVATTAMAVFDRDLKTAHKRQQSIVGGRVKTVFAQIARLEADPDPAIQKRVAALRIAARDLTSQYGEVLSLSTAGSPLVVEAGSPSAGTSPVAPRPLLNILAGLILGLLVGIGLAWVREWLAETTATTG